MNTLGEMRQALRNLGKEVTEFSGYSFKADGYTWGLLHDNPVRDGVSLSPKDWKDYIKAIKAGLPPPEVKGLVAALTPEEILAKVASSITPSTTNTVDGAIADSLGMNLTTTVLPEVKKPPKKVEAQTTCPWCDKTGGITGMKIHHFDRCKQKPKVKK